MLVMFAPLWGQWAFLSEQTLQCSSQFSWHVKKQLSKGQPNLQSWLRQAAIFRAVTKKMKINMQCFAGTEGLLRVTHPLLKLGLFPWPLFNRNKMLYLSSTKYPFSLHVLCSSIVCCVPSMYCVPFLWSRLLVYVWHWGIDVDQHVSISAGWPWMQCFFLYRTQPPICKEVLIVPIIVSWDLQTKGWQ